MALVIGTNVGFVTVAPTADPGAPSTRSIRFQRFALRVIAPEGATKIVEIGWYCSAATSDGETDVGLYSHNSGDDNPEELLGSATFSKGTDEGWKSAVVDIAITEGTTYWIGAQADFGTGSGTNIDRNSSADAGEKVDHNANANSLPNPWGTTADSQELLYAIYAV